MTSIETSVIYSSELRKEIGSCLSEKCKHHIPLKVSHSSSSSKYQFTLFHMKGMKSIKMNIHVDEDGEVYATDSMNPTITHPIQSYELSKNKFIRLFRTLIRVKNYLKKYAEYIKITKLPDIFYVFNNNTLSELDVCMTQLHRSREYNVFDMMGDFTLDVDKPDGAIYFYIDF